MEPPTRYKNWIDFAKDWIVFLPSAEKVKFENKNGIVCYSSEIVFKKAFMEIIEKVEFTEGTANFLKQRLYTWAPDCKEIDSVIKLLFLLANK